MHTGQASRKGDRGCSRVALKVPRRNRRTSFRRTASLCGPIQDVLRSVHFWPGHRPAPLPWSSVLNLPFGSGSCPRVSFTSSPAHVSAPFGAGAPGPVSGQFSPGDQLEEPVTLPGGSCLLSDTGISFLGMLLPPVEFCLCYLRLTGHHLVAGPCRGFLVPRARDTAGSGALCAPGTVVLSQPAQALRLAPAASASGQSLNPATTLIWRGFTLRRINEGSSSSPFRPSPCLCLPDETGGLGLFPCCFRPRRYRRRKAGRRRILSTDPGSHLHLRTSNRYVHSKRGTSVSQRTPSITATPHGPVRPGPVRRDPHARRAGGGGRPRG
jgi:hypothetical protein